MNATLTSREIITPDERDVHVVLIEDQKDAFSIQSGSMKANFAKKDVWKGVTAKFNHEPRASGTVCGEAQVQEFLKRLKSEDPGKENGHRPQDGECHRWWRSTLAHHYPNGSRLLKGFFQTSRRNSIAPK